MTKSDLIKLLLKILLFIILILIPIFIFNISRLSNGSTLNITFENLSSDAVSNLKIYENGTSYNILKDVPVISSNETLTTKVDLTKSFTKGSIVLSYIDNNKSERKVTLIDSIEKGSFHKVNVKINGVNNKGILLLDNAYQNIL